MTNIGTFPSIDEYLRERLMPVEGAIPHIPGIEMFVHQAARQFEIWTGKPAPWDDMLRVVTIALQERAARAAAKAAAKK